MMDYDYMAVFGGIGNHSRSHVDLGACVMATMTATSVVCVDVGFRLHDGNDDVGGGSTR